MSRIIYWYQRLISPWFGPTCRFTPSCSEYAQQCFQHYRWYWALYYSLRRILRCHPWGASGWDPVPDPEIKLLLAESSLRGVKRRSNLQ